MRVRTLQINLTYNSLHNTFRTYVFKYATACRLRFFSVFKDHYQTTVCCQVEASATSWSLVQRSLYWLWCVVVCDLETSRIRRPWPTGGGGAVVPKTRKYQTTERWTILSVFYLILLREEVKGLGGIAPRVSDLFTRCSSTVRFTLRPLYSRAESIQ